MTPNLVDARGLICPKPLIAAKKALAEVAEGETLTILIDNPTSRNNVVRFLKDNGIMVAVEEEKGVFTLRATRSGKELIKPDAESYCPQPSRPHVVCIRGDRMGTGNDDLGSILIKAFINTIKEITPLPSTIVFYNSGILLTANGSAVIEALRDLENKGVKILVCGTCADFYEKTEEIAVGTISNMYEIMEILTGADHVIAP